LQILDNVDASWKGILEKALNALDDEYLEFLKTDNSYFPDQKNFLNAFKTLPLEKTKYILFGQDPYPREESAIGYAFIDIWRKWTYKRGKQSHESTKFYKNDTSL